MSIKYIISYKVISKIEFIKRKEKKNEIIHFSTVQLLKFGYKKKKHKLKTIFKVIKINNFQMTNRCNGNLSKTLPKKYFMKFKMLTLNNIMLLSNQQWGKRNYTNSYTDK